MDWFLTSDIQPSSLEFSAIDKKLSSEVEKCFDLVAELEEIVGTTIGSTDTSTIQIELKDEFISKFNDHFITDSKEGLFEVNGDSKIEILDELRKKNKAAIEKMLSLCELYCPYVNRKSI